jgi:hypothetical protein
MREFSAHTSVIETGALTRGTSKDGLKLPTILLTKSQKWMARPHGAPDQIPKSQGHGCRIYLWPPPEDGPELWGYLLKRPRTSFTPMSQDDPKALVCTYSLAFVLKMPLRSARFRHG